MSLKFPPEPMSLKKLMKDLMKRYSGEEWDVKDFIAWVGNKLPAYLWTKYYWKYILSREGWTWQSFLKFLSRRTDEIVKWINDEISWSQLINDIMNDLRSPTVKMIYLRKRYSELLGNPDKL